MPKSETEQARLVCYSYGRECDLEAETAVSKVQNQQPEVLYLVESKGLKWQLQQIEEETACAVLDQAAELWEECFFLQQALCCDCSSGACVRRSPRAAEWLLHVPGISLQQPWDAVWIFTKDLGNERCGASALRDEFQFLFSCLPPPNIHPFPWWSL